MSEEDASKKVPPKLTIANLKKIECEVCKTGNARKKSIQEMDSV